MNYVGVSSKDLLILNSVKRNSIWMYLMGLLGVPESRNWWLFIDELVIMPCGPRNPIFMESAIPACGDGAMLTFMTPRSWLVIINDTVADIDCCPHWRIWPTTMIYHHHSTSRYLLLSLAIVPCYQRVKYCFSTLINWFFNKCEMSKKTSK